MVMWSQPADPHLEDVIRVDGVNLAATVDNKRREEVVASMIRKSMTRPRKYVSNDAWTASDARDAWGEFPAKDREHPTTRLHVAVMLHRYRGDVAVVKSELRAFTGSLGYEVDGPVTDDFAEALVLAARPGCSRGFR
jgi:hypothetical protein